MVILLLKTTWQHGTCKHFIIVHIPKKRAEYNTNNNKIVVILSMWTIFSNVASQSTYYVIYSIEGIWILLSEFSIRALKAILLFSFICLCNMHKQNVKAKRIIFSMRFCSFRIISISIYYSLLYLMSYILN